MKHKPKLPALLKRYRKVCRDLGAVEALAGSMRPEDADYWKRSLRRKAKALEEGILLVEEDA